MNFHTTFAAVESGKNEVVRPLLWASLLAVGMFVGAQLDDELPEQLISRESKDSGLDRLEDAIGFVKNRYGEPLSEKQVADAGIKSIIEHLDPHSYYLEGNQYDLFNDRINGDYAGVGIEYRVVDDTVIVSWVVKNTPAFSSGIAPGDLIWSIDSLQVSGNSLPLEQIYNAWKSDREEILMGVQKVGERKLVEKRLAKKQIPLPSVPYAYLIEDSIGYIQITRFSSGTYREFMEKVEVLAAEGLQQLIVDVRDNPGGSLDQTVKIIDQFVEAKDQLLVYLEGTHMPRVEYHSTSNVFFRIAELIILINENSISASEILAGSLQDLERATLVGRRTYGKALVQETYKLDNSSAINLSVGRYYLPSGRHIQRSYADRTNYDNEPGLRKTSGELYVDRDWDRDSLTYVTTSTGRQLPVGSGVFPDVFVAADSIETSAIWPGLLNSFKDYSFRQLVSGEVDEGLLIDAFLQDESSPAVPFEQVKGIREQLHQEIRRLSIKYQEGELPAAQFEHADDPVIQAALQILQKKET